MRVKLELLMPLLAQYKTPAWATLVAGFFVLLALSLSMYLIFEHLSAYNNPEVCAFLLLHLVMKFQLLLICICSTSAGTEICSGCYFDGPLLCNWVGKTSKRFLYVLNNCSDMFNDLALLLEQYVSLVDPNITVYCGILREGYEALAMYCFGRYITACLGKFCLSTLS